MDNQNHRENQKQQENQNSRINGYPKPSGKQKKQKIYTTNDLCSTSLALKYYVCFLFSRWLWLSIDPENLVLLFLFGFLDGFGYPLILEPWFSYLFFLSMVLAIPVAFTLVSFWFSRWFYKYLLRSKLSQAASHILFQPSVFCVSRADV